MSQAFHSKHEHRQMYTEAPLRRNKKVEKDNDRDLNGIIKNSLKMPGSRGGIGPAGGPK